VDLREPVYLRGLGRFEESSAEMAQAAEEDPLNATWQAIWDSWPRRVQEFRAAASLIRKREGKDLSPRTG
jgi:hypothetical protein